MGQASKCWWPTGVRDMWLRALMSYSGQCQKWTHTHIRRERLIWNTNVKTLIWKKNYKHYLVVFVFLRPVLSGCCHNNHTCLRKGTVESPGHCGISGTVDANPYWVPPFSAPTHTLTALHALDFHSLLALEPLGLLDKRVHPDQVGTPDHQLPGGLSFLMMLTTSMFWIAPLSWINEVQHSWTLKSHPFLYYARSLWEGSCVLPLDAFDLSKSIDLSVSVLETQPVQFCSSH